MKDENSINGAEDTNLPDCIMTYIPCSDDNSHVDSSDDYSLEDKPCDNEYRNKAKKNNDETIEKNTSILIYIRSISIIFGVFSEI